MADVTPPRRILAPEQVDDLAEALLVLARELWVVRDRQIVTELILAERGMDITAAIDAYEPSAGVQAQLDAERDRVVDRIAKALSGKR
jgi:hypothetical protein